MVLCRLCYLQINGDFFKNIFDEELDPPIWKMVYELANLTLLKTDPYTKFVCFDCYNELLKFYIFRKAVLENNQKFQQNNQQDQIATDEIYNNDIKDDPHIKMFKQNNQQNKIVTNENCNKNNSDEVDIKMEIEDEDYDLIEEKIDINEYQVNIDEDCLESVNTNDSGTDIDDKSTIKKIPLPNTIDNNTDKIIDKDSDEELMLATAAVCLIKKTTTSKAKRKWCKSMLLKRDVLSHTNLIDELRSGPDDFRNYLHMDETAYRHLLNLITPIISKEDTVMKKAITPHERLSATLKFLATGKSYEDLKLSTSISKSSLSAIIPETCDAIYTALKGSYLKFPTTVAEWKKISNAFQEKCQFPHCLGAMDGKHVQIVPPPGSGSYYFNYKKTHSIVLMAIANANYEFIMCDVGTNGRVSVGGAIDNTVFMKKLLANKINLPTAEPVVQDEPPLNYVFIGDEAFALRPDFLKPYNQKELDYKKRIFNYRLSRAKRIIDNAFGILANRFRIFHTTINLQVDNIDKVVLACCVLHNFLRKTCPTTYTSSDVFDVEDTNNGTVVLGLRTDSDNLLNLQKLYNRNHPVEAEEVREQFKMYFNNSGKVNWQHAMVSH